MGQKVIARVKVRRQDEDLRFSIESVKPLSQTSLGTHSALCVRVSPSAGLEAIAGVAEGLRRAKGGSFGSIMLEIPLDGDRVVTIALEGRYPVDFGAMSAFKSAPGVDQVRPST